MAKKVTPPRLSPPQRKAFETLATSGSVKDAAEAAGVTRQTVHRWLHEPAFAAAVRDVEADTLASVSRVLVMAAEAAAAVLVREMHNAETSAGRIRAADALLGKVLTIRELASIEERLAALERQSEATSHA